MRFKAMWRAMAAGVVLMGPAAGYPDDTDIYLTPPAGTTPEPLIMMSIDLKANNLSSSICDYDGSGADECFDVVGEVIYEYLQRGADVYGQDYISKKVNRFDIFRAIYEAVFDRLVSGTPPKIGRFGMMLSHNEQAADGGYILRGFRRHEPGDANGAINELMTKLYSLPNPGADGTPTFPPPSSGSCSPAAGTATMTANDMNFSVAYASATEGSPVTFTITATGLASKNFTFNIDTVNDTATAGSDYTAVSTTASIAKDATTFSQSVAVTTLTDTLAESLETFQFKLKEGGNTLFATGSICNATAAGSVAIGDATANEGALANFIVAVSEVQTSDVTVTYQVNDGTATSAAGDFDGSASPLTGSVTIPAGSTSAVISIQTLADADVAVSEDFTVELTAITAPATGLAITTDTGTGTIIDPSGCNDGGRYDHKYQGAELHFEFVRYLTGGPVLQGHSGSEDYGSSSTTNLDTECYAPGGSAALQWAVGAGTVDDPLVEDSGSYISPLTDETNCSSVHTINLMFGVAQQEAGLNTTIAQPTSAYGIGEDLGTSNPFANMIAWLGNTDLSSADFPTWDATTEPEGNHFVTTHIIKLGGPSGQFAPYATAGADIKEPDPDDWEAILEAFEDVVGDILSVSTTFTAASIPVQVFNRADINENVFLALFRVDPTSPGPKPSWYGNLKKLRLVNLGSSLELRDANDVEAVADDGRVKFDALTFWTREDELPAPGSAFDIDGGLEQDEKVALADGRFVERGGCGQLIPGFLDLTAAATESQVGTPGDPGLQNSVSGARQLYTQSDPVLGGALTETSLGSGIANLDANPAGTGVAGTEATELAGEFGVATADAEQLVCYVRGLGGAGDANLCDDATARSWLMADALHSRPLAINYGDRDGAGSDWSTSNPDIRILLGTNDGLFRMIQNTAPGGAESGKENWAFMPREVMPIVPTLKANLSGTAHPYGVDGVPVLLADASNGDPNSIEDPADTAWVYFGLRRGGKAYYALDVTDPDSPPTLKWSINNTMSDFAEMGLSFSTPARAVVNYDGTATKVLIFGGGYYGGGSGQGARPGYDNYGTGSESGAADLSGGVEGNAVYIVDADTGALIWKAVGGSGTATATEYFNSEMEHSIAADITVIDWNGNGVHERAYVGDMGGNIWRIDFAPIDVSGADADTDQRDGDTNGANGWQALRIAELGDGATGTVDDRRFFARVDFVKTIDQSAGVGLDVLLIGSGSREHPLDGSVDDRFFMIREQNGTTVPTSVTPVTADDLYNADCLLEFSPESSCSSGDLANGWFFHLSADGEKALSESFSVGNQVFFNTYVPPVEISDPFSGSCSTNAEGTGHAYSIDLFTARPLVNNNPSDDSFNSLATSGSDRYCDTCLPPGIPPGNVVLDTKNFMRGLEFGQTSGSSVFRTFWYEKDID